MTALLETEALTVHFATSDGPVEAVDGADLTVRTGEVFGLVGESGSGKSVTAMAIMRLIQPPGRIVKGSIRFAGIDLATLSEKAMRDVRGSRIALVPQSPRTSLNPVMSVGKQISRVISVHGGLGWRASGARAIELLAMVGVPDPAHRAKQYAHQLSGGTCQRVMIAMALATSPQLLIADEPTTGLDVSIASRIIELLRDLGKRTGAAIILITHDLGTVAQSCDRFAVMHAGQIVESGDTRCLFRAPAHPYTHALLRSIPRVDADVVLQPIAGSVPALLHPPAGCRYQRRCELAMPVCCEKPRRTSVSVSHDVACFAAEKKYAAAS
ncbi:MAG: ABC transporter ATP-binding protein [Methylobacteriaceae bacterium]|nr:ABC transporter ATP-binding protein [Methylobacteriaceae bacterium]